MAEAGKQGPDAVMPTFDPEEYRRVARSMNEQGVEITPAEVQERSEICFALVRQALLDYCHIQGWDGQVDEQKSLAIIKMLLERWECQEPGE